MLKKTRNSDFGPRLKVAIQSTGNTYLELATVMGVPSSTLLHYIKSDCTPSFDMLELLLIAMPNVDARWLITGELPAANPTLRRSKAR